MDQFIKKSSYKAGLSPGTLLHVGEKRQETVKLTLLNYDTDQVTEREIDSIREALPLLNATAVTWINIEGLNRLKVFESIGEHFGIHVLTLEDILNTTHRPKYEDFETYLFFVAKTLSVSTHSDFRTEQVSLILGSNFLISIQEKTGNIFDTVRDRIHRSKGRIRKGGGDYLAYALIDVIVDQYFVVLEDLEEKIDQLEEELFEEPDPDTLRRIHVLKQKIILLRKQIWPMRDAVNSLARSESELVSDKTIIFINDVHDHVVKIIDTIELYRDTLSSLMDLYLSTLSNRMNEVMKVLTMIATIFIPLSFVAGVYGMNFKFMPELEWEMGYWAVWGLMIGIAGALILFFKKKKWI